MSIADDLRDVVRCREREVQQLYNLLGHEGEPVPPSLFLFGLKSTGKSFTVTKLLQSLKIHYAHVDCVEGYVPRVIFESIISKLFGKDFCGSKCDNMMEFIRQLNLAAENHTFRERTNVIILERSERLRDMCPTLLPALLRLQELSALQRVCVVLISSIVWEKFNLPCGLLPPIQIFFHQYSQGELVEILSLTRLKEYPADLYLRFLNLLVAVLFKYCRDLSELHYKASVIFVKYCEPIKAGIINMENSAALYSHVLPLLRSSIQTLYLRMEMEVPQDANSMGPDLESFGKKQSLSSSAKFALSFELPFYAKYLLIAAYLASYNSSKDDKKLFVKLSDRTKKKVQQHRKDSKAKLSSLMIGPKQFDLERLLAIFFSIVEERPHISINLFSQVSSLVELQLLSKVGNETLECPKYKCLVGLDFVINISRTVGFTVTKYLTCFM